MRARYVKIILWIVAMAIVWDLGQSYTVTNSLFVFAAAGVVPGTNIVLQPDQVLWLLGSVLALAVALIFGTNMARGLRGLVRRAPAMPLLAEETAAVSPLENNVSATTKRQKIAQPAPIVIIFPPNR